MKNPTKTNCDKLISKIKELKKGEIKKLIDKRLQEFKSIQSKSNQEVFKELCFCLLTANFNAERSIMIQKEIGNGFITLKENELAKKLKELGHRFPNTRARYIIKARDYKDNIKDIVFKIKSDKDKRAWLIENIKGLGYKEASHFLRNIGFFDVAIIDFHIVDLLVENKIIKRPKSLTKRKYLEIEEVLREISNSINISLGELDLYLWYLETGKVLK